MQSNCIPTLQFVSVHLFYENAATLFFESGLEFVSSDDSNIITWNTSFTAKSIYHMSQQKTLQTLTENNDMSEDGTQILAYSVVIKSSHSMLVKSRLHWNHRHPVPP